MWKAPEPRSRTATGWSYAAALAGLALLAVPHSVAATNEGGTGEPVAMILLAPDRLAGLAFAEVQAGDRLTLEPGEVIEALDYRKCEEIRVTGGRVEVRPGGLRVDGGERRVLVANACADTATTDEPETAANLSVNLRGSETRLAAPAETPAEPVRVSQLLVRFAPLVAEAYPTALVGPAGLQPTPVATDKPLPIDVPDLFETAETMTLQLILVAPDAPPRVVNLEVGLTGELRPTKVVFVR